MNIEDEGSILPPHKNYTLHFQGGNTLVLTEHDRLTIGDGLERKAPGELSPGVFVVGYGVLIDMEIDKS